MGEFEPEDQSQHTGSSGKDVGDVPQPDEEASGECPFPFVFLHDPARGWSKHRNKVMWAGFAVFTVIIAVFVDKII